MESGTLSPSREEFEQEADPMPPADSSPPPLDEIRVAGTTQLGLFDAGGKKPTSASMRLTGGKVGLIDGQAFRKGDTVVLEIVAVVDSVKLQDKKDGNTGIVVSCEQQHTARVTDVRIVEDDG